MFDTVQQIAVVGGGIAGIITSYLLGKKHNVTLFEKNQSIGGHTNTIEIPSGPDKGTPVDAGFIIFNENSYPTFLSFLQEMGVKPRNSNMSFSFYSETTGFHYSNVIPNGLFAQRKNLLSPTFWQMLFDVIRFAKESRRDLAQGSLKNITLAEYLAEKNYSDLFKNAMLIPSGVAIWSIPSGKILEFPAETFVQFLDNHQLLGKKAFQWKTVTGGSYAYVKRFLELFSGTVKTNAKIKSIRRCENGSFIRLETGEEKKFDQVVIATHADEALRLLEDPSEAEKRSLGAWSYERNKVVLHTDTSVMPQNRRIWSSWNVREKEVNRTGSLCITYYMNLVQGLKTKKSYFVTLNPPEPIDKRFIIKEIDYSHPIYDFESVKLQKELPLLNGVKNTYYCGSYFGCGFHEDGVRSGVAVAKLFGIKL